MKIFKLMAIALVAMLGFSACEKDCDHDFIEVDHSKDLVGTWTCMEANYAEALVINADGSVLSTGVEDGEYWENIKGNIKTVNNKMTMTFEDDDNFEGRFEMIPGEAFVIIEEGTGDRLTYRYCKQDLSKEIVGMWVMNGNVSANSMNMIIQTMTADGKAAWTGFIPGSGDMVLNLAATYKVIGDLFIVERPDSYVEAGDSKYVVERLIYTPNGTAYGDIMTHKAYMPIGDQIVEVVAPYLRIKETLNLANQKYDYIKTYVTNVKGLDKDIPFMGYTFNFAKMTSTGFDKFLKTILFAVEFPNANTIKYSCVVEGTPMSMECPIEVDGNKMTVKMSERYAAYRDIDFYTYQDKDDSQMHMYMPTYTFENFFSNIQVGVMAERGELDLNDAAAVEAVHKSIADAVETINVSFIMSKSK